MPAKIHEEMLESPADAISTYDEILGHDGDNVDALRALDRLYVGAQQWQDLGGDMPEAPEPLVDEQFLKGHAMKPKAEDKQP
mgnify:CR=1 FL=1